MAIIVEDGTAKADAECYDSVANVKAYHTLRTDPAAISGAADADIEASLREATMYLDGVYLNAWPGSKLTQDQALSWPRIDADSEGWYIATDIIPQELKDATAELVLLSINATPLLPDQSATDIHKTFDSVKIGDLEVREAYSSSKSSTPKYSQIEAILAPLLGSSQRTMIRG